MIEPCRVLSETDANSQGERLQYVHRCHGAFPARDARVARGRPTQKLQSKLRVLPYMYSAAQHTDLQPTPDHASPPATLSASPSAPSSSPLIAFRRGSGSPYVSLFGASAPWVWDVSHGILYCAAFRLSLLAPGSGESRLHHGETLPRIKDETL